MSSSLVGRKLNKYEITALIGKGGMATVYKGYQPEIDRYVAIKVLPPHPGQDEQFIERFRLEARTIARLQHPHILPLYDYGMDDNILYLVMAFMDGGSLSERIRRQGAMAPSEVERLLGQVASALDYAHRQNIIHRDIKPDNILLDREGFALLADFGIVKIVEAGGGGLTVTGGLMGTPAYMSPEQGQGLPIDPRSDVYSLGVVVYEMLTGKPPYTADTPMQLVFKQINAAIPDIRTARPDLPVSLSEVMHRALAKSPDDRYESAGELLAEFKRALSEDGAATLLDPAASRMNMPRTGTPTPLFTSPTGTPPPDSNTPTTPQFNPNTPPPTGVMGTPIPGTMSNMHPTIITQPGWNPLILLIGLVIIGLLVVILVVILLNFSRQNEVAVVPTNAVSITASLDPTQTPVPTRIAALPNTEPMFGRLNFGTTRTTGDTLTLRAQGLRPPSQNHGYVAWLMSTEPDAPPLKLGQLVVDSLGEGLLTYIAPDAINLAVSHFAVTISLEAITDMENPLPVGEIVYSGAVPLQVPAALGEILIASPSGFDGGSLLDGAVTEARIARQHSGLAAESTSPGAMHTHAEHTINILRGTLDDFTGDGRGANPGRGVGVFFFLDAIDSQLSAVANVPEADTALQAQLEVIRVCINNVRTWANDVIDLEMELAASETLEAVEAQRAESTRLAGAILDGIDLNANGQVESFEGECGLNQIASYGIAVSSMELREGAIPMLTTIIEARSGGVGAEATPESTAESA